MAAQGPVIATKAARQARIAAILTSHTVTSQAQLCDMLAGDGVTATQATVSRDLVELSARKIRDSEGRLVYAMPPEGVEGAVLGVRSPQDRAALEARFARLAVDLVISIEAVGSLILIRTPAGAAQYLAAAIDQSLFGGNLGTIGGDDTILVVTRDEDHASDFVSAVWKLLEEDSK